ncbi:MAG: glycosyl hydrolase family 17 protein [Acidimicrobiia bacterium]|nr:glycosyl hydrolase family 17 protein [Acidimicrobiia bacterium]
MSDVDDPSRTGMMPLVPHGRAICYSGYRANQNPRTGDFPSHAEVTEDLQILQGDWDYLRLYDSSRHAEIVLDVIEREELDFMVMLGLDFGAEVSNPDCPWGAEFDVETLTENRCQNDKQVVRAIELATNHRDIVFSVAVGNEAAVDWTDHMVPVERLIEQARKIKAAVPQPVTSCDNYVPWGDKLAPLAAELDFISIHTYPVWEYHRVGDALAYSKQNYEFVASRYPDKPVVITEAGWTTGSNGRGIDPSNASEEIQAQHVEELLAWTDTEEILTFVFEAFDEPWKGSPDPLEPEKHWGLFKLDRTPKLAMQRLSTELQPNRSS